MKKMTLYIVYRHGSNAANQSMTQVMAVGIWEAASRAEATQRAAVDPAVVVYANQYLEARPYSRSSHADQEDAEYADRLRRSTNQQLAEWKREVLGSESK